MVNFEARNQASDLEEESRRENNDFPAHTASWGDLSGAFTQLLPFVSSLWIDDFQALVLVYCSGGLQPLIQRPHAWLCIKCWMNCGVILPSGVAASGWVGSSVPEMEGILETTIRSAFWVRFCPLDEGLDRIRSLKTDINSGHPPLGSSSTCLTNLRCDFFFFKTKEQGPCGMKVIQLATKFWGCSELG